METLLCPIYLSTNALSNDRFSIGLIMACQNTLFFNYSEEKLNKIKHLFPSETYSVIKLYLKSIYKSLYADDTASLLNREELLQQWVNEGYLSYLERYSNNSVLFGKTTKVAIPLSEEVFKKFFEMYVFHYPISVEKEAFMDITKKPMAVTFYKEIEENVNLDKELTPLDIENLLVNTKVNFIGKNTVPTAGNMLNLQKGIQHIGHSINSFISLTKVLDSNENTKGVYYLIGEEPNKALTANHRLWQELRNTKIVKYVELKDIGEISAYLTQHEVSPYFLPTSC